MYFCKKVRGIFVIVSLQFICILFIEVISLKTLQCSWKASTHSNSTVILIVADPQLLGYRNEPLFVGWLTRWDSDRYIARSYAAATKFIKPSLEIFLGDLFDEGVESSENEFQTTKTRFNNIFPQSENRIYIPGDNDIRGEKEPVYSELEKRFYYEFSTNILTQLKNSFSFIEINLFNNGKPKLHLNSTPTSHAFNILLSHVPVIPNSYAIVKETIKSHKIFLILSAHEHTASIYIQNYTNMNNYKEYSKVLNPEFSYQLRIGDDGNLASFNDEITQKIVEFQTPSCSYRMGVYSMGYLELWKLFHLTRTKLNFTCNFQ